MWIFRCFLIEHTIHKSNFIFLLFFDSYVQLYTSTSFHRPWKYWLKLHLGKCFLLYVNCPPWLETTVALEPLSSVLCYAMQFGPPQAGVWVTSLPLSEAGPGMFSGWALLECSFLLLGCVSLSQESQEAGSREDPEMRKKLNERRKKVKVMSSTWVAGLSLGHLHVAPSPFFLDLHSAPATQSLLVSVLYRTLISEVNSKDSLRSNNNDYI